MVKVIASNRDTKEDIIYELMKIESAVYSEDMQGEYESIKARFQKYPEMFYLAYDENEVVGYLCYFPISQGVYDDIMYKGHFRDDDIEPKDIPPLETAKHVYFLSIALYPEYQNQGIADKMMEAFEKLIHEKNVKECQIEDVIATTVTYDGEKFVKRYGFNLHLDKWEKEKFKVYAKILA